jgi:hypothetical protein
MFRRVQEQSELIPVMDINGVRVNKTHTRLWWQLTRLLLQVHCISQLQDGLCFVLACVDNIPPSLGFEMLGRIVKVLKDYCGILDEETVLLPFAVPSFCHD